MRGAADIFDDILAAHGVTGSNAPKYDERADSFDEQWEYIITPNRFNVVMCSRRSGKTVGAIHKTVKRCVDKPGHRVLYIGHVRVNAKLQFFQPLLELLDSRGIPYKADRTDLIVRLHNGSVIRAVGCDKMSEVRKRLGDFWDIIFIDEAQDFADELLAMLVDKAILPMLIDRGGGLDVMGTPPQAEVGLFYKLWTGGKFHQWGWNMFQNTKIDAAKEVREIFEARGIAPGHPIYEREVMGRIVVDPDTLVYEYQSGRNDLSIIDGLAYVPEPNHPAWRYALGLDLGMSDHDAIVVVGWRKDDITRRKYERYSWQQNHEDFYRLAEKFSQVVRDWHPEVIVGDTGGHGAVKVIRSLETTLGVPEGTIKAKPSSVNDSIAVVNDEFRTGRLLVDPNGIIAHDAKLTVWKPGLKGVEISDSFHSDALDALRYAIHAALLAGSSFATAPTPEPSLDERRWHHLVEKQRREADPFNPRRMRM